MPRPGVKGRGGRDKTYLHAFLDDASRIVPFAAFYRSENAACFTDCFKQAMLRDLGALNRVFWAWLEGEYHQMPHRGLEGKTPVERFLEDQEHVRPAPETLERMMRMKVQRRVGRDRTVRLEGRLFETPD